MSKQTAFYFIYGTWRDDEEEDAEMIVEAESEDQAVSLWRRHFAWDEDEGHLIGVFKLPELTGEPRAIEWQSMRKHK